MSRAMKENQEISQLLRVAELQTRLVERYNPWMADDKMRSEFARDIAYLVHLIYREAQEPLVKQITDFVILNARPAVIKETR